MRLALEIGLAALLAGCAGGALAPSRSVSGQSGGIAWEIRDVARNGAQGGWDYDLVLAERAGIPVRFERQEVTVFLGDTQIRPLTGAPFSRSLDRRDKVRLRLSSAGPEAGDETKLLVWRRFIGEDPAGRGVVVDVRFYPAQLLDPGAHAAARITPRGSSRPAAERLKELETLRQHKLISEEEYQATRTRILQGL
jgi:hypothetical protein